MSEFTIGPASADDYQAVPRVELAAAALLDPVDLPPAIAAISTSAEAALEAQQSGRLIVARSAAGEVVGFALLEELDGHAHLEELDVDPSFGRRGIGRALVSAASEWARARGDAEITLSTFGHVPWNAPFYASMGFETVPASRYSDEILSLRRSESELGLDIGKRVVMSLRVGSSRD